MADKLIERQIDFPNWKIYLLLLFIEQLLSKDSTLNAMVNANFAKIMTPLRKFAKLLVLPWAKNKQTFFQDRLVLRPDLF